MRKYGKDVTTINWDLFVLLDEHVVSECVLDERTVIPRLHETAQGHKVTSIKHMVRLERGHPHFNEDADGDMYQYLVDYESDRSERESVGLTPLMQRPTFEEKPPFVHAPYIPVGPGEDFPAGESEPSIPTTDAEQEDTSIPAGPGPGEDGSEAKDDKGWNSIR